MESRLNLETIDYSFPFLSGGGEMGAAIRSFNWENTALGHPGKWPQSLQTTLGILLNSRFPMFLFWGADFIQFYNDAYKPSLGDRGVSHSALGEKGELYWKDNWPVMKSAIDQVIDGGETTYNEDQLIPILLNGSVSDTYWTFNYTPVKDEAGKVGGVLVVCTENTEKVKLYNRLVEKRDQLEFAIEATELGTWDYNSKTQLFSANERLKNWFGIYGDEKAELKQAINIINEDERERIVNAIRVAIRYESGGTLDIEFSFTNPITKQERWVHAKGKTWFGKGEEGFRFNGTVQDITEAKNAEEKLKQSEAQLLSLANTIPQLAWMADASGYIYWYNQRWYDYTGTTLEDMQGWQWQKVHHPDTIDDVTNKFKKAIKEGSPYEQTFLLRSKEGEYRWFLTRALPIYDQNGVIKQWFGTNTDVTEQHRVEEALKESENKFRTLAETLPLLVWMTDADGKAIYASQSWEAFSGVDPSGEGSWEAIVHKEDFALISDSWKNSMLAGVQYHSEVRLKNKQGEYRWHVVDGVPIRNAEQRIINWIGAFTDMHEQKLKEQKKDEFISIASHEMKTPLTTAKGYLELLLDELNTGNDIALLYATKANIAVGKLNRLITELLDASKIQHGKLNYNITRFDFDDMLTETIENIKHGSKEYQIKKQGMVKHTITGDKERLQQVVTNLLSNAIKYSPGQNVVEITITEEDKHIKVSVRDFGVGIPAQHLDNLFEKYYRVHEHAARFQGLGIGLYISHEIVIRHNGKMWVNSEEGKGSTFYFTLPVGG